MGSLPNRRRSRRPKTVALLPALALVALTGCVIPRSGPTAHEIASAASSDDMALVELSEQVVAASQLPTSASFAAEFRDRPELSFVTLGPGDRLAVTIWESGEQPVFSGGTNGRADLGETAIDEHGSIYVPYAGSIAAAGQTPSQLRQAILARLRGVVLRPQVDVRVVERRSSTVTVQGMASKPGIFPIDVGLTRLSQLLATAAPDQKNAEQLQVSVRRGPATGTVRLADVLRDPAQDISLQPGDSVVLSDVVETVTLLGATGLQGQFRIPRRSSSILDALALARGLHDDQADPNAVYLFRQPSMVATNGGDARPTIFHVDMREPRAIFLAGQMQLRDGDVLFIGDANFTQVKKVLTAFNTGVNTLRAVDVLTQ